ncbi:MAG: MlaD family protein, partial [Opitutaceae bacterium]
MKRRLSPAVVGAFVIGAALLAVVALMSFGAGGLFKDTYRFVVLIENSSVSGLDLGSPVKLSGVRVGRVESVTAQYDPGANNIIVRVVCDLEADTARSLIADGQRSPDKLMHDLIVAGLHAELNYTGITGLLYVDLGMQPSDEPAQVAYEQDTGHPVVPLAPSFLSEFADSMSSIAANLATVDFAGLSVRANTLLEQLTA